MLASIAETEKQLKKVETEQKASGRVIKTKIEGNQIVITGTGDLVQTPKKTETQTQIQIQTSDTSMNVTNRSVVNSGESSPAKPSGADKVIMQPINSVIDRLRDSVDSMITDPIEFLLPGARDRDEHKFDSLHDFSDYLTIGTGILDPVFGTVNPEEPLSLQHWVDSTLTALSVVAPAGKLISNVESAGAASIVSESAGEVTSVVSKGAGNAVHHNPINPGPLSEKVAGTFRSSTTGRIDIIQSLWR